MSFASSLAGSLPRPLASAITGASGGGAPTSAYAANGFNPAYVADFTEDKFYVDSALSDFATAFTDDSEGGGLATMVDSSGNLVWRPHSLVLNSATPATQSITVVLGADYTVEITGSGSVTLSGAGTGTVTAGSPVEVTASTTTLTLTVSGSPSTMWAYRSDLGGMANNPDTGTSYVPTTSSARFLTRRNHYVYNGSTYDRTCLHEPAGATNLDPNSDDLSAWTTSSTTVAKDQAGADGVANSAHSITATGANGTALEQITASSADHAWGCLMKRVTGTGTVDVTVDGGSTWVAVTSDINSSEYVQVSTGAGATVTNPEFGVRLGTSGDAVAVQVSQLEQTSGFISSPIPTNGSTVARTADVLKPRVSSLPFDTDAMSVAVKGKGEFPDTTDERIFAWTDGATQRIEFYRARSAADVLRFATNDTGSTVNADSASALVAGAGQDVAFRVAGRVNYTANQQQAALNGTAGTQVANNNAAPAVSTGAAALSDYPPNVGLFALPSARYETLALWSDDVAEAGIEEATA